MTARSKPEKLTHILYALAMKQLLEEPATTYELAETTGLHINTCRGFMRALKDKQVIHVSAWEKDAINRETIAVYSFGDLRDVRPNKKTPSQRTKVYRARKTSRLLQAATAGAAA